MFCRLKTIVRVIVLILFVIFIFLIHCTQRCHFLFNMTMHSMVVVLFVCKLFLGKYFSFYVTSTILFVEIELYSQEISLFTNHIEKCQNNISVARSLILPVVVIISCTVKQ